MIAAKIAQGCITLPAVCKLSQLASRLNYYQGVSDRGVLSCQLTHESHMLVRKDTTDASDDARQRDSKRKGLEIMPATREN